MHDIKVKPMEPLKTFPFLFPFFFSRFLSITFMHFRHARRDDSGT